MYDSPSNRYIYSSGEIDDDTFGYIENETEFNIVEFNDLPEVKEVMTENFLALLRPLPEVDDEGYNEIERHLLSGDAEIGYWTSTVNGEETTTYMLIL